jgi:hypothetical protein
MRLSPCKTALSLPVLESRLTFQPGPFGYGQKGVFSGDLAARSHDCAWITGNLKLSNSGWQSVNFRCRLATNRESSAEKRGYQDPVSRRTSLDPDHLRCKQRILAAGTTGSASSPRIEHKRVAFPMADDQTRHFRAIQSSESLLSSRPPPRIRSKLVILSGEASAWSSEQEDSLESVRRRRY